MRFSIRQQLALAVLFLAASMLLTACGGGGSSSPTPTPGGGTTGNNVESVTVAPGPANNVNTLLANVTVCQSGTSNCQTINDVLVDTGSVGLRLFSDQVNLSLPGESVSGAPLAECSAFLDSVTWGPVVTADVQLAGEKASNVPIQLIGGSNYQTPPSSCSNGLTNANSVSTLGANGILGVGLWRHDCGAACTPELAQVTNSYYTCPSSGCSSTFVELQNQVQNPVWLFPQDNNGVLISLGGVTSGGQDTDGGNMIFGISTENNNQLGSAQVFPVDGNGNFITNFNGQGYSNSYLDTGSNGLYFLDSSTTGMPTCSDNSGFYCPASPTQFTATVQGASPSTTVSGPINFTIGNADSLCNTCAALPELGGPSPGSFDWGLPFFFGRNVFVAINGTSTPAGNGPFWAF